ncbi:MAG TPA: hypothetical protein VIU11_01890 [Nakamurella sp.]
MDAAVAEIWDPTDTPDPATLLQCLKVGIDRNLTQDPLPGFRLFDDISQVTDQIRAGCLAA